MNQKLGCLGTGMLIVILLSLFGIGINLIYNGFSENNTGTIIFGLILVLIPLLTTFGFLATKLGSRFRWTGGTKWIITLSLSLAGIAAITLGVRNVVLSIRPDAEILSSLQGVCSGQGVGTAAGYSSSMQGPFYVVLLKENGEPDVWSSELDQIWKPASLPEVNFVICLSESKRVPNNACFYERATYERDVRLVDARTGATISSMTLTCSLDPCAQVKTKATETSCSVNSSQVNSWLERQLGIGRLFYELNAPVGVPYPNVGKNWGTFVFEISPDGSSINIDYIRFAMEGFACGPAVLPKEITFVDEPSGPVSNGQFDLEFQTSGPGALLISGFAGAAGEPGRGTWEFREQDGTSLCSGSWGSD